MQGIQETGVRGQKSGSRFKATLEEFANNLHAYSPAIDGMAFSMMTLIWRIRSRAKRQSPEFFVREFNQRELYGLKEALDIQVGAAKWLRGEERKLFIRLCRRWAQVFRDRDAQAEQRRAA